MSNEAKTLALANPRKPWARRWLRANFHGFLPPALEIVGPLPKKLKRFVKGASISQKPGVT